MKLLGSPNSPYARKVRIAFEEKHINYEYVIARPSDPSSGVSKVNPLGKVPVLVCDDEKAIYDSPVIVEYLDGLVSVPKLIPEAFADRIEVKRWEALGDGITDATVLISHDERLPELKRQTAEWYAKQQSKIDAGLATMERDLGSRQFCYGTTFTLADIACGMALGYLDRALPKFEWRKSFPALRALAERLAQRESFKNTLPS
jgi:glutathione S-transferase